MCILIILSSGQLSKWPFFFELLPCAHQGSDGHLNVCGLENEEALIGPWQMPCKRPGYNQKTNQQNKNTKTTRKQTTPQDKDAPRWRGEKVKHRALSLCTQPFSTMKWNIPKSPSSKRQRWQPIQVLAPPIQIKADHTLADHQHSGKQEETFP